MSSKYKSVIFVSCFSLMFLVTGIANTSMSLYMIPICEEFGFLRGQFSVVISLLGLTICAGALLFNPISKRIGFRAAIAP